ncbi:CIC11C00000005652 [Sungouiella intermedia]|uniref:CIC11C00000005652 n=1 Tax=Sungouiella intermedia TaxID=45354 RepID=A0A1L0B9U0_9ASCO|nr:CIC11C00000005652 [[Candida] intermedia]
MNVSRNGYYTSEYIDQRLHGTPKSILSPETNQYSVADTVRTKSIRFDLPSSESEIEIIADPDDLPEDITPAQLTYLHKPERQPVPVHPVQKQTPVTQPVSYDKYYRTRNQDPLPDDDLFEDQASSANTEELLFHEQKQRPKQQHVEYKGYYIDQKKRYDEAEFIKPRNYKHKTFKDVFVADHQDDENYNPIDIVFEDPEKVRDQEQKKTFMRAVKNVQTKLGKDNYDSYDYYAQQQLEKERQRARDLREMEKERLRAQRNIELEEERMAKAAAAEQRQIEKEEAAEHKRLLQEEAAEEKRLMKEEAAELRRLEKEKAKARRERAKLKRKSGGFLKSMKRSPVEDAEIIADETEVQKVPELVEERVVGDVFVDDYDSDYEYDPENPHSKKLRKNIKKKWNLAKRQLEENYFDNYARKLEEEEIARKQAILAAEVVSIHDAEKKEQEKKEKLLIKEDGIDLKQMVLAKKRHTGPNSNFNPFWNYLLSYLVYDQPESPGIEEVASKDKIVEIVDLEPKDMVIPKDAVVVREREKPKLKHRLKEEVKEVVKDKKYRDKLREETKEKLVPKKTGSKLSRAKTLSKHKKKIPSLGFAFNFPKPPKISLTPAKEVFSNWNQPASAFFAGQRVSDRELVVAPFDHDAEHRPLFDEHGYPIEHTIIYDGSDVDEELIYDPETGEFRPVTTTLMADNDNVLIAPLMRLSRLMAHLMALAPYLTRLGTLMTLRRLVSRQARLLRLVRLRDSLLVRQRPGFSTGTRLSTLHLGTPLIIILNINLLIKRIRLLKIVFAPIDVISEMYPSLQTMVILIELVIFMWMLYELSLLIDAICMTVKAVCAPMIAIGKFMNRIM